jgi:hypothetical protein
MRELSLYIYITSSLIESLNPNWKALEPGMGRSHAAHYFTIRDS